MGSFRAGDRFDAAGDVIDAGEPGIHISGSGCTNPAGTVQIYGAYIEIGDESGRTILLDPSVGLLAKDSADNIIHDLQNAALVANQHFLGHPSTLDEDSHLVTYDETTPNGIKNIDITSKIGSSTNIKGAIIHVSSRLEMSALANNNVGGYFILSCCKAYNDNSKLTKLHINKLIINCAADITEQIENGGQFQVPVFWNGGNCYLSLAFGHTNLYGTTIGYLWIDLVGTYA